MTTTSRFFNKELLVILGLAALLFLAGIILLPGMGTYADEVQAQISSGFQERPEATTQERVGREARPPNSNANQGHNNN